MQTVAAVFIISSPNADSVAAHTVKSAGYKWKPVLPSRGNTQAWSYAAIIALEEFYSVALSRLKQQADTGTKMIHLGKNTRSTIIAKGISAADADNTYRGLVRIGPNATNARNYTQCDSLLIGRACSANTIPIIECNRRDAQLEHEATSTAISEQQLFYCMQRGLSEEDAIAFIVNGFCKSVFDYLPMEFAVEAQKLLAISLEGAVG